MFLFTHTRIYKDGIIHPIGIAFLCIVLSLQTKDTQLLPRVIISYLHDQGILAIRNSQTPQHSFTFFSSAFK